LKSWQDDKQEFLLQHQEEPVPTESANVNKRSGLSLDSWAVFLALALALIVKLDLFKKIPW
jgi:hypothetical protein